MPKKSAAPEIVSGYRVEVAPVEDFRPYERNARVHSAAQIDEIAASMRQFGWTNPLLVDVSAGFVIVAGHGRVAAAKQIYASGGTILLPDGRELAPGTAPYIDCSGWDEAQRRAYIIADNRIAENATWDEGTLRLELTELQFEGFDVGTIGFDAKALDQILRAPDPDDDGEADADDPKASLADRFGIAPFSVLNAREGWWQDRKRAWLSLGIQSEVGRGENLLKMSDTMLEPDPVKRAAMNLGRKNAVPGGGGGGAFKRGGQHVDPKYDRRKSAVPGNSGRPSSPSHRDPSFYEKKRAWEAANGRKISTAEFRLNHWDGAAANE